VRALVAVLERLDLLVLELKHVVRGVEGDGLDLVETIVLVSTLLREARIDSEIRHGRDVPACRIKDRVDRLRAGVIQEGVAYIAIYNAQDDAFDIVGYPTRDASQITTGELDDDRLSDNVPLKNATNTFSGDNTFSIAT